MKKIFIICIVVIFNLGLSSQNLLETYKKGEVKLVPISEYGQNVHWDDVFKTYNDTLYGVPMGDRKSLILTPDGSVVVNHQYRNFYSKFSPEGRFVKEFGITGESGKRFKKTNNISGVINGDTFFTGLDNMGNMYCFDFDGHYKKTLVLDYMSHGMEPLPNGKIAVLGWAIWKTKFRNFVSLVDYETGEEKVIYDDFTERRSPGNEDMFSYAYKFEKGGMISFRTINVNRTKNIRVRSKIAVVGDNLILANPGEGTIIVFDFDGNKVSELTMNLGENYISVEDQKQIQMKNIEKFSKKDPLRYNKKIGTTEADSKKAHEYFIAKMKEDLDRIKEPIRKPYFSTVLRDSDDNLLFFELPDEENSNVFNVWVYNNGGEFVCQSSFVCDEYELQINPSKMVFRDGFIYGLQKLKNVEGVPLRLVKFKLQ